MAYASQELYRQAEQALARACKLNPKLAEACYFSRAGLVWARPLRRLAARARGGGAAGAGAVAAHATVMADALDLQQAPVDFAADLEQVRQIG